MADTPKPQPHAPRGRLKATIDPMPPKDPLEVSFKDTNRCKATNRQGVRCRKPAIRGGTVCRMHGGAAPQVKNAAEARLRALEMPAIERMARLIDQEEFPSVAYQASRDVLDRLRGKPTEHVEATVTSITSLTDEELEARAITLLRLAP